MYDINIIDPSSTEFNRGSFCYAPYLCYNGFNERSYNTNLMEAFRPEDLDTVPDAEIQVIALWSYPQIESAILLAQMLPFMFNKNNVYFVGYTPLIQELGLRHIITWKGYDPLSDHEFLKDAMFTYPTYYKDFHRLLLSDCDMHLKHLEKDEKVYPLFTSYGCPNGCAFCPSTKNCGRERIELNLDEVKILLEDCKDKGIKSIHFTDEDFFFNIDRAHEILRYISDWGMHLIALGSAEAVLNYYNKYGTECIKDAGLEVIEIGFESGSEDLSKSMGSGKSLSDCHKLAELQHLFPFNIFWLVQTFFPGETIKTLNDTGAFMIRYGFNQTEVVGRLRTNGTKGGLGQFFQPYHGTSIYLTLEKKGVALTARPVRLIPSYLPNSFLDSVITEIMPVIPKEALEYLQLYNVPSSLLRLDTFATGHTLREYITGHKDYTRIQVAICFAIFARFGIIK